MMIVKVSPKKINALLLCIYVCFISLTAGIAPASAQNNPQTNPSATMPPQKDSWPDDDKPQLVPGQLIVRFKSGGAQALTESLSATQRQRRAPASSPLDNTDSLDILVKRYNVRRARSFSAEGDNLTNAAAQRSINGRVKGPARAAMNTEKILDIYLLEIDPNEDILKAAREFGADPQVEFAEPNYIYSSTYEPNDPFLQSSGAWGQSYGDLWGIHASQAIPAWDTSRGRGVIVAVVDSGVDRNHPDLAENMWVNSNETINGIDDDSNGYVDDVHGWNFDSQTSDPMDDNGHGTHVAGTIAAQDNNARGIVGIAPDAKIMALKGLSAGGGGGSFNLAQAIVYAAANGADIISNSWGCQGCPDSSVLEAAAETANALGSVIVFSAGNSRSTQLSSPHNGPYSIVVGANDPSNQLCGFSNYGYIDVLAPGCGTADDTRGILSLKSNICPICALNPSLIVDENYLRLSGTSMAAPHVSGLAALVLEAHPEYSAEQVRQVIRHSTFEYAIFGFDFNWGYGRINAFAALNEPTPLEAQITVPHTVSQWPLPLSATVTGEALATYTLSYKPENGILTELASGTTAITNSAIGEWNDDSIADGNYVLYLQATTNDGRTYDDYQPIVLDRVLLNYPVDEQIISVGDVVDIIGSASAPNLINYDIAITDSISGVAVPASSIDVTDQGNSRVTNGVLATWNTADLKAGHYQITLEVTTPENVSTETVNIILERPMHLGWPQYFHNMLPGEGQLGYSPITNQPTIIDLDGDALPEILIAYNKEVFIFSHDGSQLPGWPKRIDDNSVFAITNESPAVGDIDGDGILDIVVANDRGRLFAWHADGSLLPNFPFQLNVDTCSPTSGCANANRQKIALYDMDGDGALEIISSSDGDELHGSILHVLRGNTTSLPGFPIVDNELTESGAPVVADFDKDGLPEIAFFTWQFPAGRRLHFVNNQGQTKNGFPINYDDDTASYLDVVAGDIDNDGRLELLQAVGNTFWAFNDNGSVVPGFPYVASDRITNNVLGDITGDDKLEIVLSVAVPRDNQIFETLVVLNGQGTQIPQFSYTKTNVNSDMGFTLADADGDGIADILSQQLLQTHTNSYVVTTSAFKFDGSEITRFANPFLHTGYNTGPVLADVDGDNLYELLALSTDGRIALWDTTTVSNSEAEQWPMFRFNPQHTGAIPSKILTPSLPARIQAQNYNGYSESDTINHGGGGSCDRGDGVDMEVTLDQGGGCNIGWTAAGEFLTYNINVADEASFKLVLRLASAAIGKTVDVSLDGKKLATIAVTARGWQAFDDYIIPNVPMVVGPHTIKVTFNTGSVNFNYLDFIEVARPTVNVPAKIQAENYLRFTESDTINQGAALNPKCNRGDGVDAEIALEDGTCLIGWTTAGEALEYGIRHQGTAAGIYQVNLRVAANASGRIIDLLVDGVSQGRQIVPQQGWQTFSTLGYRVSLAPGDHTLKVVFVTGSVNFNYLDITAAPCNPCDDKNIVINGNFSQRATGWLTNIDGTANATINFGSDAAINIVNGGTNFWSVQFTQGAIAIKQGKRYQLSFDTGLSGAASATFNVTVQGSSGAYTTYLPRQTLSLAASSGTQRKTFTFTMQQISDLNSRIAFNFGAAGVGTIFIDNIVLQEVAN